MNKVKKMIIFYTRYNLFIVMINKINLSFELFRVKALVYKIQLF